MHLTNTALPLEYSYLTKVKFCFVTFHIKRFLIQVWEPISIYSFLVFLWLCLVLHMTNHIRNT